MEQPIKQKDKTSNTQAYIVRMPTKMHNDLKLAAIILHTDMQDIVLSAVEERLNQYKESNEKLRLVTKDDTEEDNY